MGVVHHPVVESHPEVVPEVEVVPEAPEERRESGPPVLDLESHPSLATHGREF